MGAVSDLIFASVAMALVFAVIGVLTACFYASGVFFTRVERRIAARSRTPRTAALVGIPAEHVAVIAAALAMHRWGSGEEMKLLSRDRSGGWSADACLASRPDALPALRRTR